MDRIAALTEILQQNPDDTFARYGLAMAYSAKGDVEAALEQFNTLLAKDPNYTAAYHMAGQMLFRAGRSSEARKYLQEGIGSALRLGNAHAAEEMNAELAELG